MSSSVYESELSFEISSSAYPDGTNLTIKPINGQAIILHKATISKRVYLDIINVQPSI